MALFTHDELETSDVKTKIGYHIHWMFNKVTKKKKTFALFNLFFT